MTPEYGSSENQKDFPYLFNYSPLHNVRTGTCYPATLITTADHDDRVVPSHSFKFAATMQAAQGCAKPVLTGGGMDAATLQAIRRWLTVLKARRGQRRPPEG